MSSEGSEGSESSKGSESNGGRNAPVLELTHRMPRSSAPTGLEAVEAVAEGRKESRGSHGACALATRSNALPTLLRCCSATSPDFVVPPVNDPIPIPNPVPFAFCP